MKWRASVQTVRLDLEAISDGVMQLRGRRYRAVLEVAGVPFGLKSDAEQEAILASFAGFLNSLSFPIQMLVRVLPLDIDGYLARLEYRARHELPERLAELALDHVAFVRRLARLRTLLERHFYIVVPAQDQAAGGCGRWLFFRRRRDAELQSKAATKQLTFRCEEMARQLGRCGLTVRRMENLELAELLYASYCPELSRLQRLRRDLEGYTSLVVRAAEAAAASTQLPNLEVQHALD